MENVFPEALPHRERSLPKRYEGHGLFLPRSVTELLFQFSFASVSASVGHAAITARFSSLFSLVCLRPRLHQ